jgi:O-antigen/teichoic acid export membrane protein
VGVPLMLLVPVPALLLVPPIFGESWSEAGVFIAILTPLYAAQLLSSPLGGTLTVLERQDLLLVRELARICLLGAAIVIAELLAFPAAAAVAMLSAGGTLAYVVYGAISFHALRAYDRERDERAR